MWILIKDAASCIWEKVELYSENKHEFSRGFTLDYKSSDFPRCSVKKKIIFEVYFSNEENVSAKTEKMSDKECFITIYLPNTFGIYGKNKKITKPQAKLITVRNTKNICKLIRTISHEITHVFDPLFNNIFYTKYYANKYKSFMLSLEEKTSEQQRGAATQLYYDSQIELTALTGEFEAKARILRNSGVSKEEAIRLILTEPDDISDFEKYLESNRPIEWSKIQKKIRDVIDFIYSDEKFLFI